jgi:hypothetical protein
MADINQETEDLARLMAEVNRQMRDYGQLTKQTQDQVFDARVREKTGIRNATEAMNSAGQAVGNLAKAAAGAASELYNGKKGASAFNSAVDGMSSALQNGAKTIGSMFPALKGAAIGFSLATQAVTAYAKAANTMADGLYKGYQGLAKSGAAASDGMSGVFSDAKKLGLSMSELDGFVQVIGENSRDLALFAGSVSQGRKRFADINQIMDGPVRTGLMNLGMSVQDIADGTAGYIRLQSRLGRAQNMTNDELAAGAARYLKEQDALTKLTGMNRKDAEAAREEILSQERFAAVVAGMRAKGQDAAADQLTNTYLGLRQHSKQLAQGFADASTGMLTTEAAQQAFRATQGENVRIAEQLKSGQIQAAEGMQRFGTAAGNTAKQFNTLAQAGAYEKPFGDFSGAVALGAAAQNNFVTQQKKINADQDAAGADGSKHADAMTANQVKIVDTQIKINKALETFVKDGIVPTQKAMQKLADIALGGANAASDMGPKGAAGLAGTAAGAYGGAKLGAMGGAAIGSIVPVIGTAVGAAIGMALGGITGGLLGLSAANAGSDAIGLPGRSEGSLGATGKMIEDFGKGTPMMLHGREGIITEKQLKEFGNNAMTAGLNASGGGLGRAGALAQPDEQIRKLIQENRRIMDKQVTVEEKILDSKTKYYDFIVSQIDTIEFNSTQEKKISAEDLKNIKDFSKTRDQLLDDILNSIKQQATIAQETTGAAAAGGGASGGGGGSSTGGGTAPVASGPSAATEVEGARGGSGSDAKASEVLDFTARSGSASAFKGLDDRVESATIAAAEQYLAATGKKFQINSAKRDPDDQKRLWDESVAAGRPGRGPTGMAVARPGRSPHEHGLAVDIQNYNDPAAVNAMNRQGLKQKVPGDPVHFSFGDGGIANGPSSGYLAELHGPEAVVPLPDGKTIPVRIEGGDFGNNNPEIKNELRQMMTEFKSAMQGMVEQMNNKAMIMALDEMVKAQKTGNDIQKKMLQAQS